LEHAAAQGSPLALLALGHWHRRGLLVGPGGTGSTGSGGVSCRAAAQYFLAVADQPRVAAASMGDAGGVAGSGGGSGGGPGGGAPVGFYDDVTYGEKARLGHRWLSELSRGGGGPTRSPAVYGMVGAEGGGPAGGADGGGGQGEVGWLPTAEEVAFHVGEANRLLPPPEQGAAAAGAGAALGGGGGWWGGGGGLAGRGGPGNGPAGAHGGGSLGGVGSWLGSWGAWLLGEEPPKKKSNKSKSRHPASAKSRDGRAAAGEASSSEASTDDDDDDDSASDAEDLARRARAAGATDADYDAADSAYAVAQVNKHTQSEGVGVAACAAGRVTFLVGGARSR
jgi:hypothetical protein